MNKQREKILEEKGKRGGGQELEREITRNWNLFD